jgi:hypothetical protein
VTGPTGQAGATGATGATGTSTPLSNANNPIFGNGQDGTVTFDGVSTVLGFAPVANVYTLTRSIYTHNVTVDVGVEVKLNGYQWFDTGTGTNNGHIDDDGYGTAGRVAGWYHATIDHGSPNSGNILGAPFGTTGSGGAGGLANGGAGGTPVVSFAGGGGGGGTGAGTAGGNVTAATAQNMGPLWDIVKQGGTDNGFSVPLTFGAAGEDGGVGTNGAGGFGGTGGGCCFVAWHTIAGTGVFSANGANGAVGVNSGGGNGSGGGGGGGGGVCMLTYETRTGSTTATANGGTGGIGGTSGGGNPHGGSGGNGGAGLTALFNLSGDGS